MKILIIIVLMILILLMLFLYSACVISSRCSKYEKQEKERNDKL